MMLQHRSTTRKLLSAFFLVASASVTFAQVPAFPGALGFGASATGGRNGTVYHVTTLADSGAGSFRDAVSSGNRVVVFDVGGYITLNSAVSVQGNITIAGQTAPGGGIGFKGGEISFASRSNIICRFIRIRPGSETSTTDDALSFYRSRMVICDHVSLEFAPWNNIDGVSDDWQNHPVDNITVQNSIIADPIYQQFGAHTEAVNGTWSWYYNIFANSHNRNPLAKVNTIFVNNVLYNYQAGYTTHTSTRFKHDIINNYFIMGPGSGGTDNTWFQIDSNQSIYYSGNLKDVNKDGALNGSITTPYWYSGTGTILSSAWSSVTSNAPIYSTATAYYLAASLAGALPRDEMDQLVIDQMKTLGSGTTGTGVGTAGPGTGLYTSQTQTGLSNGGYGTIAGGTAPADTDRDGMPDYWESTLGSNLAVDDHKTQVSASAWVPSSPAGYTLLDEYLHFMASPHGVVAKNTVDQPTSLDLDLSAYAYGFPENSIFTLFNITNGAASLLADGHTAHFVPPTDFAGRARFDFTVSGAGSVITQTVYVVVSSAGVPRDLIWRGDGASNMWDTNALTFLNGTNLTAFQTGDSVLIDDSGSNSPAINLSGAIAPGTLTVNAAKDYTFSGSGYLSGGMTLTKSGSGTLTVNTANSFGGSTEIQEGTVILNTGASLGTGALTLDGGTLTSLYGSTTVLNLSGGVIVPAGETGALNMSPRLTITGLSGGGTLNLTVPGGTFIYENFNGTFANFTGTLNATGTVAGAMITANFNGGAFDGNLGNAIVNLDNVMIQGRHNSGGNTLTFGALSGTASSAIGGSGYAGNETLNIGAKNLSTTFAGSIGNGVSTTYLTKVGTGTLTLSGNNTYSGATTVSAGTLMVNGDNGPSAVTVATNATLGGTGTLGGLVTVNNGGKLSPGVGAGTLSLNGGLTLNSGKLNFDLANVTTTGGGVNDLISMSGGTLTLNGTTVVNPVFLNGSLANGNYTLISGGSSTVGSAANLSWGGGSGGRQTFSFDTSTPGTVQLVVGGSPAANLVWRGFVNNNWDAGTLNWWNGAAQDRFYNLDLVLFDNTGSGVPTVNLTTAVAPAAITVDSSANYTFNGPGAIAGSGTFTKAGTGTLVLNTTNSSFSGNVFITGGTLNMTAAGSKLTTGTLTLTGGGVFNMPPSSPAYFFPGNVVVPAGENGTLYSPGLGNGFDGKLISGDATSVLYISSGVSFSGTSSSQFDSFNGTINILPGATLRFSPNSSGNTYGSLNPTFVINGSLRPRNAGNSVRLGALSGNGSIEGPQSNAGSGDTTYIIGGNNSDASFMGTISSNSAVPGSVVILNKVGSGTLILGGNNTYSGGTTVSQGVLVVNNTTGSGTGTNNLFVESGAALSGNGIIGSPTVLGDAAKLIPGDGVGTLTFTRSLNLSDATVLNFELGTNSDQVIVNGDFLVGGILNVTNANGFGPGTYVLISYNPAASFDVGNLIIGSAPAGYNYNIDTETSGQVRLIVSPVNPPSFGMINLIGANLVVSGSGGTPGGNYYVLSSTNVALPAASWTRIATNQFDGSGNFAFTNAASPASSQGFFRLQLP